MEDFRPAIRRHSSNVNAHKARIDETFESRDRSERHYREWSEACRAFHALNSEVAELTWAAGKASLSDNERLRRFAFDYLDVDPIHFRSGYDKELILRRVKALALTDEEKAILRRTILRRVRRGAMREFKHFCRLIPKIVTPDFLCALREQTASKDCDVRRRANFALRYAAESGPA